MRRALIPLALLAAVVAGCGETEIDAAEGERFITNAVEEQTGARVESVECPTGLIAEKGATFECTVVGDDGSSGDITVTEEDDEGAVTVDAAPFLRVRDLEEQTGTGISDQTGAKVAVQCPEIVVFEAGDTFECEATSGGDTRTVLVTQKDDKGNVRYELQ